MKYDLTFLVARKDANKIMESLDLREPGKFYYAPMDVQVEQKPSKSIFKKTLKNAETDDLKLVGIAHNAKLYVLPEVKILSNGKNIIVTKNNENVVVLE